MHTGQSNPHSVSKEYISEQIVLDPEIKKHAFHELSVSINFATSDYDAHINTIKIIHLNMFLLHVRARIKPSS